MKGILPVAAQWLADGRRFAIATVVGVRRSARARSVRAC